MNTQIIEALSAAAFLGGVILIVLFIKWVASAIARAWAEGYARKYKYRAYGITAVLDKRTIDNFGAMVAFAAYGVMGLILTYLVFQSVVHADDLGLRPEWGVVVLVLLPGALFFFLFMFYMSKIAYETWSESLMKSESSLPQLPSR